MSNTRRNQLTLREFESGRLPYRRRATLLSSGERRFYFKGLKPAIGKRYLISFKVRLADVISVDDWTSKYGRKISQKHLDFVLVTPKQTRIAAAVELNDATHSAEDRRQRDNFLEMALQSAGIPLIVFPIYARYDPQKIRQRVFAAIDRFRKDLAR